MSKKLSAQELKKALTLLNDILATQKSPEYWIVVCGGAALALSNLVNRTTEDVDILALMESDGGFLISPAPLPTMLLDAAKLVAEELNLPPHWLNNGPSQNEGGLFQMGLPSGTRERLDTMAFGKHLKVSIVSRRDQVFFKLYAAIDQPNSYHTSDLKLLKPTADEIRQAFAWARTHDASEGFQIVGRQFLQYLGFDDVAEEL